VPAGSTHPGNNIKNLWKPCHKLLLRNAVMGWRNGGGNLAQVVGKRCSIAGFPFRWEKGDGSIVRAVATVEADN
jgi:kynurenine formamidase